MTQLKLTVQPSRLGCTSDTHIYHRLFAGPSMMFTLRSTTKGQDQNDTPITRPTLVAHIGVMALVCGVVDCYSCCRTSSAARSPDLTAPSMYWHQPVAVSVPAQ